MARVNPYVLVVACALSSLGVALPCHAQEAEPSSPAQKAAQSAHRHALQLFDRGEHRQALAEFRRAYSLAPSFRILYNVGLSSVALGDASGAIDAFAAYLREGGDKIPEARRTQVESEITRLSRQLAGLTVDVREPGAELLLDGASVGKAPLSRQLRLNPGKHDIVVRSTDGTVKSQVISLAPGEERLLDFAATSAPARTGDPPKSEPPPSAPPAAAPPRREAPWLAWGVTGVLGASAAVTGVLALGARSDERDAKGRQGVTASELGDKRDKTEKLALATDILLAGTAVAAGVSLYLTLRPAPSSEPQTAFVIAPGRIGLWRSF
jgi:hypothetical protein